MKNTEELRVQIWNKFALQTISVSVFRRFTAIWLLPQSKKFVELLSTLIVHMNYRKHVQYQEVQEENLLPTKSHYGSVFPATGMIIKCMCERTYQEKRNNICSIVPMIT